MNFYKKKNQLDNNGSVQLKVERAKLEKEKTRHQEKVEKFEKYCASIREELEQERNDIESEKKEITILRQETESKIDLIGDFIHEQKRINERVAKAIDTTRKIVQHHRYEKQLDQKTTSLVLNNWKSVEAFSEISNLRMLLFEFCVAPDLFSNSKSESIHPYKYFEKIYKSINSGFDSEARSFDMRGTSHCKFISKRILPIAFFILLDNAWKYTLPEKDIVIDFNETGKTLFVNISNWGPWIEDEELDHITERGIRGKIAEQIHSDNGKGLGLAIACNILNVCGVKYEFSKLQCEPKVINDAKYGIFNVKLTFSPISH